MNTIICIGGIVFLLFCAWIYHIAFTPPGFLKPVTRIYGLEGFDDDLTKVLMDSSGQLLGYRIVKRDKKRNLLYSITTKGLKNGGVWVNGYLRSHRMPTTSNRYGIHAAKNPYDPTLCQYATRGTILVEVILFGRTVEEDHLFRAENALVNRILMEF